MNYGEIQKLKDEDFRRVTGFKRETFAVAVEILTKEELALKVKQKSPGGPSHKKTIEERLLIACQYWREYRTYLHIAVTFGISKSAVQRIVIWIEDTLIKSGKFNLPGKKALRNRDPEFEIVVIDATETPINRPKKTKKAIILVKRSGTPSKRK